MSDENKSDDFNSEEDTSTSQDPISEDNKSFDTGYVERLKKEVFKWKSKAKENKDASQKFEEAEKRLREAEESSQKALSRANEINTIAEKRMINAEIRAISLELGLKKIEYAKLCNMTKVLINEDGEVLGVREALQALKESDPDLFKLVTTTNINIQNNKTSSSQVAKVRIKSQGKEYEKQKRDFLRNNK